MLVRGEHAHHAPVQLCVRLGAELPKRLLFLGCEQLWFGDIVVVCVHKSDMNLFTNVIYVFRIFSTSFGAEKQMCCFNSKPPSQRVTFK